MAETGWTEGPWEAVSLHQADNLGAPQYRVVRKGETATLTRQIASIYADLPLDYKTKSLTECLDEGDANARLIAAAPTMAEALSNVRKIISEGAMEGFNPKVGTWAQRLFESQQCTSAALARARGQEQEKT